MHWVRGQRFVEDGDVVITAGILSGTDGTLHRVERLAGRPVAAEAAAAVFDTQGRSLSSRTLAVSADGGRSGHGTG